MAIRNNKNLSITKESGMRGIYLRMVLFLLFSSAHFTYALAPITFKSGSFIVNMGVVPQTIGNGLKPYGLVFELIKTYQVPVYWVINPAKVKDGIDFSYGGIDYKGGTFVIPGEFITATIQARITDWKSVGVVGAYTTSNLTLTPTYRMTTFPTWTLDRDNGNLAYPFFTNSGIPTTSYNLLLPSQLSVCNDIFVMPHADPTWDTHNNLYFWNLTYKGAIWLGCHAGSALADTYNPANSSQQMNFLSTKIGTIPDPDKNKYWENSLLLWTNHKGGSPPYNTVTGSVPNGTLASPSDPVAQYMGVSDAVHQNGSEQIYVPVPGGGWLPSTKIITYDPDQDDVKTNKSPGPAVLMAYGRGFGDPARGLVMYEAGHDFDKGSVGDIPAQRAFFNWSFLSAMDKTPVISSLTGISAGGLLLQDVYPKSHPLSLNFSSPIGASFQSVVWSCVKASDGSSYGSFSPNGTLAAASTIFTTPQTAVDVPLIFTAKVVDQCGRFNFESFAVTLKPQPTAPTSITLSRQDVCFGDPGTVTLTANGGYGNNVVWYANNCGSTSIGTGTSLTIPVPGSTTTYYANWVNETGSSTCASATVTIHPIPVAPTSSDLSSCYNVPATLTVSGAALMEKYKWYDAATGGNLLKTSSGSSDNTLTTGTLTLSTAYYVSILSFWNCEGPRTRVNVNVQPAISPGTITANQTTICAGDPLGFTGTPGGPAGLTSYRWETSTDGINWIDAPAPNDQQNYTSPIPFNTTTQFRRAIYFISGEPCTAYSNIAVLTVLPLPPQPILSASEINVCKGNSITITASPSYLPGATYTLHYLDDGSGIYPVLPADVTNTTGIFTVSPIIGKHLYTVSVLQGGCRNTSNPIELRVYDIPSLNTTGLISSCSTNSDGYIYITYSLQNSNFLPGDQNIEFSFDNGATWSNSPYKDGLAPGTYTVIARNRPPMPTSTFCSTSATVNINLVLIETTDAEICQGDVNPVNRTLSAVSYCTTGSGNSMNYEATPDPSHTFYVAANPIPYNAAYPIINPNYVQGPLVRYFTYAFSVQNNSAWNVTAVAGNSNPPDRLSLYKYPFDPENPAKNLLAMDDTHNGGKGFYGEFDNISLYENTNYVIVASYYDENIPPKAKENIKLHLDNGSGDKYIQTELTPAEWYKKNADGSYTLLHTGDTFDPLSTAGSGLTDTNTPGIYTWYVGCLGGGCRQPAILTIDPIPVPHASGPEVYCSGSTTDITLTSTMNPSGTVITFPWNVSYTWTASVISSTNPSLVSGYSNCLNGTCGYKINQTLVNTSNAPAVIRYSILAKVKSCESPVTLTFDVTVNPVPNFTISPISQQVCPDVDIMPIIITPTTAVSGLSFTWTRDNGTILYPGIAMSGTGPGTGFSITGKIQSTQPLTANTTTFTISAAVNNFTCVSKTTTVIVQENSAPTITCPANVTVSCAGDIPPKAMDYASFVLQAPASATGDCAPPTVIWVSDTPSGSPCDYTISRVYLATTQTGLTATCTQLIHVKDDQKPIWMATPANQHSYCVEDIHYASWNLLSEPATDIMNSVDATPVRPDYHILTTTEKNAYSLDPDTYFKDNCTPAGNLILHWSLISMATGNYVTDGGGNLLDDETDALTNHVLKLDGAVGMDIYYQLKYWLEDACGNISDQKSTVDITIKPRPVIKKMNE